ncbi:hypothetical protein RSK20926_20270 [Roseobacter sp. SK209-2-6]|nr:hypothetical protein RSK20926_20270 [Roseobacter sp. SK209-2-6]
MSVILFLMGEGAKADTLWENVCLLFALGKERG